MNVRMKLFLKSTIPYAIVLFGFAFSVFRELIFRDFLFSITSNELISNIVIASFTAVIFIPLLLSYSKIRKTTLIESNLVGTFLVILVCLSFFYPWIVNYQNFTFSNIVLSLLIFCSVGIVEETVFRGIVYESIKAKTNLIFAFFISSLLFGLSHLGNVILGNTVSIGLVLNTTLMGLVICAIYQYFGIVNAIIFHILLDATSYSKIIVRSNNEIVFIFLVITSIIAMLIQATKNNNLTIASSG